MWPPLFLWLTIIAWCYAEVLRLISQIVSGRRGIGMPKIQGKNIFQANLCYHAVDKRIRLQEQKLLGIFFKNLFWIVVAKIAA
jgi:hypothetical protein